MPGPNDSKQALTWIKGALVDGRYNLAKHFGDRLTERDVDLVDVHAAVRNATQAVPYEGGNTQHGGTAWRVWGLDVDGERLIGVGVEAFLHKKRHRVFLCTVMVKADE